MLSLYGLPRSNFANMVRTALVEKKVTYQDCIAVPGGSEDMVKKSPMGMIPWIETDGGTISETLAILDYIDRRYAIGCERSPFEEAREKQLNLITVMYLEQLAREGYGIFFDQPVGEEKKQLMKDRLPRVIAALSSLIRPSPWILGSEFTSADIVFYWTVYLAQRSFKKNCGVDLIETLDIHRWYELMSTRASIVRVTRWMDTNAEHRIVS